MKKKIIQIGGNLRINGISSFIMTLYRNMHEDYQFIFINTAEGKDHYRQEITEIGGKVYDVIVKGKGLLRSLRQAKAIRRIIKEEKPVAVHSHYYSNNGIYLYQAYKEGVPVRISHCHQSNPSGLTIGKKIAKWFSARLVKKFATESYACSETARRFLYGDCGEVVFNSVDYEKFCLQSGDLFAKYKLDKSKRYFLFVGRFSEQKNINFLLDLCDELKFNEQICFLLVGHGPKKEMIEKYISDKELKNVVLLPPDSNVPELLSVASAFVLPSLYEGLPITLIEAQAVGAKCLMSDKVTSEVQLGLIEYLPLDKEIWIEKIVAQSKQELTHTPSRSVLFDDKFQTAIFDGIYSNIDAEEWIIRGKEYSIGSKRFLRSKELSFACFKKAHEIGNVRGSFYYALCYFEGNGVKKDKEKAARIVSKIIDEVEVNSKKGDASYIVILADMYSFGLGKKNDFEKAFELYLKAAELGNLEAMCDLGYMYLVGQGVSENKELSAYWYKKSADLGYVHSMRDIGQNYLNGYGVEKSVSMAMQYFALASAHNYSHGTTDLAYCYLNELGEEQDLEKVKNLLRLAFKQDPERTVRDLIALDADVAELLDNNKLVFLNTTEFASVTRQNSYDGVAYINEKVSFVDPNCFYTSTIKKIFVEKGNPHYSSLLGVLFDKAKKSLVRYPIKSTDREYIVPDGVEVIGAHAFQNARNLKKIILPTSVSRIEDSAFDDCKSLEEIIIPASVTVIGDWAFHGCDKLKKLSLSKNVARIGLYAFGSCEALEEIRVDEDNSSYKSLDGNLYTKDGTVLLQYAIGKKNTEFILPDTVKTVAFRAISDAFFLEYIDLNNAIFIEKKAMYYATSLKKVKYKSEASFGDQVFDHTSDSLIREVI